MDKDEWNYRSEGLSLFSAVMKALEGAEQLYNESLVQYIVYVLKRGEQVIKKDEYPLFLERAAYLVMQYVHMVEMQMQESLQKTELLRWLYGELQELEQRAVAQQKPLLVSCVAVKRIIDGIELVGGKLKETREAKKQLENDEYRTHLKQELYKLLTE